MSPAPLAFRQDVTLLNELLQAQLERAGFSLRELNELSERKRLVICEVGEDLLRERVEVGGVRVFDGDLFAEDILLLHKGAEEEHEPGFPVSLVSGERGLGAAEGAVVALF